MCLTHVLALQALHRLRSDACNQQHTASHPSTIFLSSVLPHRALLDTQRQTRCPTTTEEGPQPWTMHDLVRQGPYAAALLLRYRLRRRCQPHPRSARRLTERRRASCLLFFTLVNALSSVKLDSAVFLSCAQTCPLLLRVFPKVSLLFLVHCHSRFVWKTQTHCV